MNEQARNIQKRIRHGLIPAVPVPFNASGEIDGVAQEAYARWMSEQPIAGVAVWVHTGRGLQLSHAQRKSVFASWRDAMPQHVIIAGAGADPKLNDHVQYIESARAMAKEAAALGADAILAFAPTRFRDRPAKLRLEFVREYHEAIAEAGLPLILFYLYEAAGGISYSDEELADLFALESVLGIKMATLDSVMTFQRVAQLLRLHHPEQLLITGEDRFLGYSLMLGAESALIGMAAARTNMLSELLESYFNSDYPAFLKRNAAIDQFAQLTFTQPMEGYIQRMLRILANDGIISQTSSHDPWGPKLSSDELDSLAATLDSLK